MAKVWGNAKDLLSKSYSEPMQGAKIWMEGEKKNTDGSFYDHFDFSLLAGS